MSGHEELSDSIASLALGVLPEGEARSLAAHARTCAACAADYAELRAAADAIAFAAELLPGELNELSAARMKSRVMNAVRASLVATPVTLDPPAPLSPPPGDRSSAAPLTPRSSRFATWIPSFIAAAAVIVAFLSTANVATLRSQNADTEQQVALLRTQLTAQTQAADRARELDARLADVTAPGSKHFTVPNGEVVTSGGHVFLALRVAPLASGKVYQAWTLHAGAHAMAPSTTFVPGGDGIAFIELPEPSSGLHVIAVSVEPAGGSKAPTTAPTFVRTLS